MKQLIKILGVGCLLFLCCALFVFAQKNSGAAYAKYKKMQTSSRAKTSAPKAQHAHKSAGKQKRSSRSGQARVPQQKASSTSRLSQKQYEEKLAELLQRCPFPTSITVDGKKFSCPDETDPLTCFGMTGDVLEYVDEEGNIWRRNTSNFDYSVEGDLKEGEIDFRSGGLDLVDRKGNVLYKLSLYAPTPDHIEYYDGRYRAIWVSLGKSVRKSAYISVLGENERLTKKKIEQAIDYAVRMEAQGRLSQLFSLPDFSGQCGDDWYNLFWYDAQ